MKHALPFLLVAWTLCLSPYLFAGSDCSKAADPGQCADCCSYRFTAKYKQEFDSQCSKISASDNSREQESILLQMSKVYSLSSKSLEHICSSATLEAYGSSLGASAPVSESHLTRKNE